MRRSSSVLALAWATLGLTGCLLQWSPTETDLHRQAIDLFHQGRVLQDRGDWREAISLYERSIAVTPTPTAHAHLGRCLMELGEYESAENHLARALELSPTYHLAETHLMEVRARRTDAPSAPAPQIASLASDPTPPPLDEIVGIAQAPAPPPPPPAPEPPAQPSSADEPEIVTVEETHVDDAPAEPEPVVEGPEPEVAPPAPAPSVSQPGAPPTVDEVRALLFPTLHGEAQGPSGAQRLRATRLDSPDFHLAQARAHESNQDPLSAIGEYRRAFDLDPTRIEALLGAARLHAEIGHEEEALQVYERALEIAPNDAEVPFQTGNHFFRLGDSERAVVFYRRTLELDPDDRRCLNNMGAALRDLDRLDEARMCLERAVEIDPTYAPPHRNLGNLLAAQGHEREALEAYQRYVLLGGSQAAEVSGWIRDLEQRLGTP